MRALIKASLRPLNFSNKSFTDWGHSISPSIAPKSTIQKRRGTDRNTDSRSRGLHAIYSWRIRETFKVGLQNRQSGLSKRVLGFIPKTIGFSDFEKHQLDYDPRSPSWWNPSENGVGVAGPWKASLVIEACAIEGEKEDQHPKYNSNRQHFPIRQPRTVTIASFFFRPNWIESNPQLTNYPNWIEVKWIELNPLCLT